MGARRRCAHCGHVFAPKSARSLYCSAACRRAAAELRKARGPEELTPKECPVCGKVFTPQRRGAVYCSQECRARARDQSKTFIELPGGSGEPARFVETAGGEILYSICPNCRRAFIGAKLGARFCCEKCAEEWAAKEARTNARRKAAQEAKNAPLTVENCTLCKSCEWCDLQAQTCDFCNYNLHSRGGPVSEGCSRYTPRKIHKTFYGRSHKKKGTKHK